jgi:hypothetical protein
LFDCMIDFVFWLLLTICPHLKMVVKVTLM